MEHGYGIAENLLKFVVGTLLGLFLVVIPLNFGKMWIRSLLLLEEVCFLDGASARDSYDHHHRTKRLHRLD